MALRDDAALLILTSLAGGPKHGYAMIEDIATMSGVRLGPGALFGVILKLYLTIWVGPQGIQTTLQWPSSLGLQVTVYTAGTVGSLLVTAAGGAIAAGWRYRRWRPLS